MEWIIPILLWIQIACIFGVIITYIPEIKRELWKRRVNKRR